ncbi:MAG: hypothetical protein ACD_4C00038G0001, partial [uncultured bacterium (gcode 4)]
MQDLPEQMTKERRWFKNNKKYSRKNEELEKSTTEKLRRSYMSFKNLNIGLRLFLSYGIIFLLVIVLAFTCYRNVKHLKENNTKTSLLSNITEGIGMVKEAILSYTHTVSKEQQEEEKRELAEARKNYHNNMEILATMEKSDTEGVRLLEQIKSALSFAAEANNKVIEIATSGDNPGAGQYYIENAMPRNDKINEALKVKQKQQETRTEESFRFTMQALVLLVGVIILIGCSVAYLITRSITKPLAELIELANRVAAGDLTVEIEINSRDEIGQLGSALQKMVHNLREMILHVSDTSNQVASAANQLHSTAEQIATGAEEVASQTGTVATASEEMSATSGNIAQ